MQVLSMFEFKDVLKTIELEDVEVESNDYAECDVYEAVGFSGGNKRFSDAMAVINAHYQADIDEDGICSLDVAEENWKLVELDFQVVKRSGELLTDDEITSMMLGACDDLDPEDAVCDEIYRKLEEIAEDEYLERLAEDRYFRSVA